jgi:hypothetical protein
MDGPDEALLEDLLCLSIPLFAPILKDRTLIEAFSCPESEVLSRLLSAITKELAQETSWETSAENISKRLPSLSLPVLTMLAVFLKKLCLHAGPDFTDMHEMPQFQTAMKIFIEKAAGPKLPLSPRAPHAAQSTDGACPIAAEGSCTVTPGMSPSSAASSYPHCGVIFRSLEEVMGPLRS